MGVVGIDLDVHEHVTPVNVAADTYPLTGHCPDLEQVPLLPAQVIMSDNDKVGRGRLLHRKVGKNHGRARAVLRLTAAEWPPGTADYKIILDSEPGSLRAYDAETDGGRQALPLSTKVSDLTPADKTLWIEGAKVSSVLRDIRLFTGLNRSPGGLSKEAKNNADWARFTVVKIEKVALEHTPPPAGQPKTWNPSKKRWYINYQAGDAGRTVTIRAPLSQPIAGIRLHFMLSPDKNNLVKKNWGEDLPAAWNWRGITLDVKQKDKVNPTDLLHRTQDTDAKALLIARWCSRVSAEMCSGPPPISPRFTATLSSRGMRPLMSANRSLRTTQLKSGADSHMRKSRPRGVDIRRRARLKAYTVSCARRCLNDLQLNFRTLTFSLPIFPVCCRNTCSR